MALPVIPNPIVTVNVSTILAPAIPNFQNSGALVSFGGTTLVPNTTKFLTQLSDLTSVLTPSGVITAATWATNEVTITTTSPFPSWATNGTVVQINIVGIVPVAYNGTVTATIASATTFTFPLASNPGTETSLVGATWQINSSMLINAEASTFFRQGSGYGCYVLELGYQPIFSAEISALETWLANNPLSYYGYLLPDYWGNTTNIAASQACFAQYEATNAMTYFWVTVYLNTIGMIPNTMKSVIQFIESPGVAATRIATPVGQSAEFSIASMFFAAMSFKATPVTRISPMCFKFVYGVTAYPTAGNATVLTSFKTDNVNYIQTGAEGGIAFTNVYPGVTSDGKDYFNWWWTIDWVQINVNINLSNAIINGSNNPLAPLYYNQPGINYLQSVLASTMRQGVSYGMVLGSVVQTEYNSTDLSAAIVQGIFTGTCNVNAVPFIDYSITNPSDYGNGEYDGLSTLFIPSRGFVHILVQIVATNIVTL